MFNQKKKTVVVLPLSKKNCALILILFFGFALCTWQLGTTGLVDETPALFAAAGRAMAVTGDWLTPKVNGLVRFDKPPLVYWFMGVLYALPFQPIVDPLGTWAARLPSSLASVVMMLALGEIVMTFPQRGDSQPRRTGVAVALAFGLSPLVMLWSRAAVSDSLLTSTLGLSLLCHWRRYANPINNSWRLGWIFLSLAVLTKGPVALVLTLLVLIFFGFSQSNFARLWECLHPLAGLLITCFISVPWYLAELIVEGRPFWDSFFGYHNFQRFTSVVNSHLEPWWFFFPVLIIASLPFTPLLFLGLLQVWSSLKEKRSNPNFLPKESLKEFASCWLLATLLLFTFAATKLPSYWLPATPAAALLIGLSLVTYPDKRLAINLAWGSSVLLMLFLSIGLWTSPIWIQSIYDPEIPSLAVELVQSNLLFRAAIIFSIGTITGIFCLIRPTLGRLIAVQVPLFAFHSLVFLPILDIGDRLRHLPVRQAASLIVHSQREKEPIAMVGALKPSLHFYTRQVVLYEGDSEEELVNLSERFKEERRQGWEGLPIQGSDGSKTALIVIDRYTSQRKYWQGLDEEKLGEFGIYKVWRINRINLQRRAISLREIGIKSNWRIPRPERL